MIQKWRSKASEESPDRAFRRRTYLTSYTQHSFTDPAKHKVVGGVHSVGVRKNRTEASCLIAALFVSNLFKELC